uniref:Choline transporter-like protein 5 n=1 Tax=Dracunculus medinensis TaxID=318479 RepID=A0A0N4UC10_DRAME
LIIKVPQNFSMTKSDYYRVNLAPLQYANSRKKSTAHCCNYTHRFESPPPPYSYYPSPLIQRIHQPRSSPPPPPLPPREKVIIGRRAARFDIRIPNKTSPISKQSNLRRNNLSFQKQYINPIISSSRSCTDGFWCFVFLIFLSGWVFVAAIGFIWGNPKRLIHPTDSEGRFCGTERAGFYDLSKKPYLLYFDLTECFSYATFIAGCPTTQVCVTECPTKTFTYLQLQKLQSGQEFEREVQSNVICRDGVNKLAVHNFNALKNLVDSGDCTSYTVHYIPGIVVQNCFLGRCMPEIIFRANQAVLKSAKSNFSLDSVIDELKNDNDKVPSDFELANASRVAADITVTWWQILSFFLATAVISLMWIIIMRILGGYMIWTTTFALVIVLAGGSTYSWMRYKALHDSGAVNDYSFQPDISVYFEMPTTWLVLAISFSVVLLLIIIIFCCIYSRVKLAVALIEESSKSIGAMSASLLFPVIPFFLNFMAFIIWAFVTIWLASSGKENCQRPLISGGDLRNMTACDCSSIGTEKDPECRYVNLTRDNRIIYLQGYNLFAFFWLTCFISGLTDMILAGAFASYYWAFDKVKDVPSFPILRSFGRVLRYHLGTIAFGSIILALTKFIRAILDYFDKKFGVSNNSIIKFIMRCLKFFFWCFEMFLKFLTRNAFIMSAIYGKNFCTSARDSFSIIAKNIVRYVVLGKVTDFLLLLGKVTVTLGVGVISFFWFSGRWMIDGIPQIELYYYFVPIAIVVIGSYFIASSFMSVYDMAVHTNFLCFRMCFSAYFNHSFFPVEDMECNDGTPDKPYYMSKSLQEIMGKHNQFKS